jgi:hypothetical protein
MTPAASAKAMARRTLHISHDYDRYHGYGLLSLPLSGGQLLTFHRATASSIGPPFTSVWQRDVKGRWTCHVDVMPDRAYPRYFGPAMQNVTVGEIDVTWKSDYELGVYVHAARLHIGVRLHATADTRLLTSSIGALPSRLWRNDTMLELLGRGTGAALRAGPLALAGHTPSGHHFRLQPRALWRVEAAAVVCDCCDMGELITLDHNVKLGDYTLTRQALFAIESAEFSRELAP